MTAIRIRLIAFLVLSAVGIVYVSASYLGIVDRVLGRGIEVQATLPGSGGLFVGSEVTYRGVRIGTVSDVNPTSDGITVDMRLEDGTELPQDSAVFVHNLSAVGEQYLDFEPVSGDGPFAENGYVFEGNDDSLPTDEGELLVELDEFVNSVDKQALRTTVKELGDLFEGTGRPLQKLLDNGGDFIDAANANSAETIALLRNGRTVLATQRDNSENITSFSRDLRLLTDTLRTSDADLRRTLNRTPAAVRQVNLLMKDLEPTLPVLLGNAISVNQVLVTHLAGMEQLLVTFPRTIAGGFTGTTPDGFGHVNLQTDNSVMPCTEGYKPPNEWRQGNELTDAPIFPAECLSPAPFNMRGSKYAPGMPLNPRPARAYPGYYDPATGVVEGVQDADGNAVELSDPGNLSVLGDDSWKWLLVGPVAE